MYQGELGRETPMEKAMALADWRLKHFVPDFATKIFRVSYLISYLRTGVYCLACMVGKVTEGRRPRDLKLIVEDSERLPSV
jgi:hypothetical protein